MMTGRPPTKQLTLQFVLRTLKRLQMVTRLDQELLAKELLPYCRDVQGLGEYLTDVAECMNKHRREQGIDPDAHPNGNCRQCGEAIWCDHNGARYCSRRCRQRAYRLRLKGRPRTINRNETAIPAIRDVSYAAGNETNITHAAPS
jgi:hypothetical protein